ncbi:MAG: hypothetical protein FWG87_05030 [Defluviitaleaceae bacterium]|nr:hypothetical protein [Defluviitaleaceae bacterium]
MIYSTRIRRIYADYADWLVGKFTKVHENPIRPLKSAQICENPFNPRLIRS